MAAKKIEIKHIGDYEMDAAESEKAERMIAQAEEELEAVRLNFSWGQDQLNIILRAAQLMGVPYPIFIKQVVYQQALALLKDAEVVRKSGNAA